MKAAPRYLRIRNWERFQHYKDRRPPWIKFHVELLDDYELTGLPIGAQLVYDRLLLVAAKHDNSIPYDLDWLAITLRLAPETVSEGIDKLVQARFITTFSRKRAASTVLVSRAPPRSQEAEAYRSKEPTRSSSSVEDLRNEGEPDLQTELERLGPSEAQRSRWSQASEQDEKRVRACLAEARAKGENVAAYFDNLVRSGADPSQEQERTTGYRAVRGTHGLSFVPDPEGRDQLPAGYVVRAASNSKPEPQQLETFVRTVGWQYEQSSLQEELQERGASEDDLHGLLDLAADLRRERC